MLRRVFYYQNNLKALRVTQLRMKINLLIASLFLCACTSHDTTVPTRPYRMGFANSAPRFDNINLTLQVLNTWTTRADAAIISDQVPWDSLYKGKDTKKYIADHYLALVQFYRSKNFELWIFIDPANGLDRSADASDLAALGKSIADNDAQQIYRRFAFLMDSILQPDHLGLALETNLIRDLSTASVYSGIKTAASAAAATIQTYDQNVKLSVSIQADHAWGKMLNTQYKGIDQDVIDFPFLQELGISSYPYFVFDKPSDIPLNYYSLLVAGKNLPVFVSEGGWSSAVITLPNKTISGSPELQQEFIRHQGQMLFDVNASAYFQLTFTDIDIAALPPYVSPTINYFAYLGLIDKDLYAKPALYEWDKLFGKKFLH